MNFYAHTLENQPPKKWEPLFSADCPALKGEPCSLCESLAPAHGHLNKVAWWTAKFAAEMFPPGPDRDAARQWGYLAGLWHDLGKFVFAFQRKLKGGRLQIEHAGAGAALAQQRGFPGWEMIAFAIAGHHSGLGNRMSREEVGDHLTPLDDRLPRGAKALEDCKAAAASEIHAITEYPISEDHIIGWKSVLSRDVSPSDLTRQIFSALVDADSLATEAFRSSTELRTRLRWDRIYEPFDVLLARLDDYLENVSRRSDESSVNTERGRILNWCRNAAGESPGFFQLNVPTGGGKTLSAMAFALRHITIHAGRGLRRIVIAVPYTSIIEQNAGVYRDIFGAQNVIEHHSNLDDFAEDEEQGSELTIRRRLACENWDAPIVVTTNVQLFESIFAHKRRRARKLHNLAGSVIVLDEAQCVPAEYLQLILTALRELVHRYGCTVVVSTATQPAWKYRKKLPFGIGSEQFRAMIPPGTELAKLAAFDRVAVEWPSSPEPTTWEELTKNLLAEPCVMAIVHRKKDARELAKHLRFERRDEQVFHLSTNMCPVHRQQVLDRIRGALVNFRRTGTPCRVVSTQLVEAGVDLDFPVIFRALAGLDSIAQAAGRCNREGRLGKGKVVVFLAESEPPDGHLKQCAEITRQMLAESDGRLDLRDSAIFEEFFIRLYRNRSLDAKNLVRHAASLNFETLGRESRLIEDGDQTPVVILFDEEAHRRARDVEGMAKNSETSVVARFAFRALQPYTVLVRPNDRNNLHSALRPLFDGSAVFALDPEFYASSYDPVFGLSTDDEPRISPARLIAE